MEEIIYVDKSQTLLTLDFLWNVAAGRNACVTQRNNGGAEKQNWAGKSQMEIIMYMICGAAGAKTTKRGQKNLESCNQHFWEDLVSMGLRWR